MRGILSFERERLYMVQKWLIQFEVFRNDRPRADSFETLRRSKASDAGYIRDVKEHYSLMSHKSNQEQKPKKKWRQRQQKI